MRDSPGVSSIGRNTAWLLLGRLAAQALGLVAILILARRFGVGGLGAYAFVTSAVFLANVVTTFGTDMVLMRQIAGFGRNRWDAALAVQLGLSCFAILTAWLLAPLAGRAIAAVVWPLRIFSLSLLPAALYSVCTAVLRGSGRMGAYAALGVALAAIQLATIAVFAPGGSLEALFAALVGVQIAAALLAWTLCAIGSVEMRSLPRTSVKDTVEMLRATGTIGTLGLLGMAYQRLPVLALAGVAGPVATGWFAAASKVVEASKTGHLAFFGAIYPAMARAHRPGGPGDGDPGLRKSWRLAAGGAAVLSLVLLATSSPLVRVLYGAGFDPSAMALTILACSLVPSTLATYQSLDLIARARETATLAAQGISLVALLGLMAILVPSIGWIGGCWAVLVAETVQAIALFAVGCRPQRAQRAAVRPAAASFGGLR